MEERMLEKYMLILNSSNSFNGLKRLVFVRLAMRALAFISRYPTIAAQTLRCSALNAPRTAFTVSPDCKETIVAGEN